MVGGGMTPVIIFHGEDYYSLYAFLAGADAPDSPGRRRADPAAPSGTGPEGRGGRRGRGRDLNLRHCGYEPHVLTT